MARHVDLECVFDVTDFGEMLAVEILHPAWTASVPTSTFVAEPVPGGDVRHYAYDPEADALWAVHRRGRSDAIVFGRASLAFDGRGELVRIVASTTATSSEGE